MPYDASRVDIHQAALLACQAEEKGRAQGYKQGQEDLLKEMYDLHKHPKYDVVDLTAGEAVLLLSRRKGITLDKLENGS